MENPGKREVSRLSMLVVARGRDEAGMTSDKRAGEAKARKRKENMELTYLVDSRPRHRDGLIRRGRPRRGTVGGEEELAGS